ncbi:maltoporin LamB [Aliagarivorans marinus]|uniref:maltoporin LamB n=1 Tax=Aliagarivorans marinus TaxID=561965 RepID=UPI0003F6CAB2|nr:maltoporin LamB [Aliagarivorans marinus]
MKIKALSIAVGAGLLSTAAMANPFEFHGYMRSGIGATASGGDQMCFQADGSPYKHRLGNECETYAEAAFVANAYEEGDKSMSVHALFAYSVAGNNDWEDDAPATREMFVKGDNMVDGLNGATIWAGKRYYQRRDVHQIDYYYLANAGAGGGIENIDLGFGKLSAAWVRNTEEAYLDTNNPIEPRDREVEDFAGNNLDLRLDGIQTNTNGELSLVAIYGKYSENDGTDLDTDNTKDSGVFLMAEHAQGFMGGFNKLSFTYANDAMAGIGAFGQLRGIKAEDSNDSNKANYYRVLNFGMVELGANTNVSYVLNYENYDRKDDAGQSLFTIGVRPQYNWNTNLSTIVDLGYDIVDFDDAAEKEDNKLFKATVAQQWQAGPGAFARPAIRAFATYARADQNISRDADSKDEVTFGLQAEAWW